MTLLSTSKFVLQCLAVYGVVTSCSAPEEPGTSGKAGSNIYWYLAKPNTNQTTNTLVFDFQGNPSWSFSISAQGITADQPFDDFQTVVDRIELSYDDEGEYELELQIRDSDGTLFVEETLAWEYSLEKPKKPILSFSEEATADESVLLLAGGSRGAKTNEIQIIGDTLEASNEEWIDIPSTNQIPLKVSVGDGLKKFQVRYRNVFGNESEPVAMEIQRKELGPQNCSITIDSLTSSDSYARLLISADNDGPLFLGVFGDIANASVTNEFAQFEDSTVALTELSSGEGVKEIEVRVRDLAQNFCESVKFSITVNEGFADQGITVDETPIWTNSREITVNLRLAKVSSDEVEMFLSGNIVDNDTSNTWIAYSEQASVTLTPVEGNRFIKVKYKVNDVETSTYQTEIFLKPYLYLQGSGATKQLLFSNITGLSSLSVSGCTETYTNITYQEGLSCTPSGGDVTVTYFLNDDSSVIVVVTP